MRRLTKRLTVRQRVEHKDTLAAMEKVRNRYVAKMEQKGWKVDEDAIVFAGNYYFLWEEILTMVKE